MRRELWPWIGYRAFKKLPGTNPSVPSTNRSMILKVPVIVGNGNKHPMKTLFRWCSSDGSSIWQMWNARPVVPPQHHGLRRVFCGLQHCSCWSEEHRWLEITRRNRHHHHQMYHSKSPDNWPLVLVFFTPSTVMWMFKSLRRSLVASSMHFKWPAYSLLYLIPCPSPVGVASL